MEIRWLGEVEFMRTTGVQSPFPRGKSGVSLRAVLSNAPEQDRLAYIVEPATVDYDWTYGSVWIRDANASFGIDLEWDETAVAAASVTELPVGSKEEWRAEFVPALGETTGLVPGILESTEESL